ncbi:hypothetical protein OS493_024562 [Desmophyllum pertusum]|uniref:tRNA:m(4)X modification enzyme TRM13 n=1 Tax=Desmophyllum pertusum TaxID=174260 RepID=A0A9W9ZZC4_9CNID|nr:hypothetical protein OS493_024562 [Desmophyllum pertusum]
MVDKPVILKHLKQQASLIGHMDRLHLLEPSTIFMEFGAGRGKLSHWLQMALGNCAKDVDYLLIDRANNRYKYDRYHRGEDQGPCFQRLNLDIEHLDLSKVPCIQNCKRKIVAVSKHLCGAATDLTLRCLMETLSTDSGKTSAQDTGMEKNTDDRENKRQKLAASEGPVKGVTLALCCHHCCSWPQYVGRPFLQNIGFTAEDFHLLCCLSSWATCGIDVRLKKNLKINAGRTANNSAVNTDSDDWDSDEDNSDDISMQKATTQGNTSENEKGKSENCDEDKWSNYTVSEREEIGRQCKRLIDAGRLWYLESHDFSARLAFYVDSAISLENAVLLATPRT